jgi:Tfp pilus assembly protein PilW
MTGRSWSLRGVAGMAGLALVELMVAMSIFLLILVGIFQVFDPSSRGLLDNRAEARRPAERPGGDGRDVAADPDGR